MTDEKELLAGALGQFAGLSIQDFELSRDFWEYREFSKGEFYNEYRNVCKYLGFILDGVFRTYYVDDRTDEEKNVFFFSKHQVVVSFQSFIAQAPCNYYTQSMTASRIFYIHVDDLQKLYKQSHAWEKLGRLIAETAFSMSLRRTEGFMFLSPEQRYLDLMNDHPDIFNAIPLYHISSYLGIQGPSLSRIRKRLVKK
ncbi:Crp/Fnr family transcriptional regulator [Flavobacterium sp. MAH-1]|uniref:Crp/Fnr family transcriptional regulator n=1 Tax=Flavobacterium agri TaxID=2743471 RepID=A0A7Y8XZL0_9FLAO|nr:Crp/Fnr family transcriptional regulator [Flavobacterium agri]NUY79814.1 Crp/Fnr family transcriptional regulator [Flavobacterium agri]NYA69839.1 Crp/Fnr family transcriptional regulator [Flavobacterium agri]